MQLLRKADSPAWAALLTVVCYTVFLVQLLEVRGGDVSIFVVAGGPGVDPQRVPPELTVRTHIGGYDGTWFYRLALDPLTRVQTDYGITLDNPAYRQGRIGYPIIVWALSFGNRALVPWLLVLVNMVALAAMAAIGASLAQKSGRHAMWGLFFPMYPGFLITLSRDLSEIVANCFALAAVLALTVRRFGLAAVLLSWAVLTRETTLILVAALGVTYAVDRWRGRENRIRPVTFVAPLAVFLLWQLAMMANWGEGFSSGMPPLSVPFAEYARVLMEALPRRLHVQRVYFVECAYLAAVVGLTAFTIVRSRPPVQWTLAWAGSLVLVSLLPSAQWAEDIGFMRILSELMIMSGVVLVCFASLRVRAMLLLMTLWLWWYLAMDLVERG